MSAFLIDTLMWTGALLAFVLLVRRPVAQIFGPTAAYALWVLPMGRLLMPPVVLPAWMAPAAAPVSEAMTEDAIMAAHMATMDSHAAAMAPAEAAPSVLGTLMDFDWAGVLVPLWLAGAAVFLFRRYALYFRMRRELLAQARPMGEAGGVRLVETPAADGPLAFGVMDRVIALPPGFMAAHDRTARDLALAHEFAHHRGRDLLCNMFVQPLFALHWFNPLGLLGWRALRRDQEAACDARVVAHQSRESRAAYAAVIARFAVQPHRAARLALAAPMACPVLGDRSIVQRLRSLKMSDISARRRWAGRALLGAAALALPLTGSISYAQAAADDAPAPPAPPAAPSAPAPAPAPLPPEPPRVSVSDDGRVRTVRIERHRTVEDDGKGKRVEKHVTVRPGSRRTVVIRDGVATINGRAMSAAERAEFEREMAEHRRDMEEHQRELQEHQRDIEESARDRAEHTRDRAEFAREMSELQREMARERVHIDREVRTAMATAHADAKVAALAIARAPKVTVACRPGQRDVTTSVVKGGREEIFICRSAAMADARRAIASARAEVSRTKDMSERDRIEALRSLDTAEKSLRAD